MEEKMKPDCTKEELEIWEELEKVPFARPVQIARCLKKKTTYVQNVMQRLLNKGHVLRNKSGYYVKDIVKARMIRELVCERRWH